MDTDLQSIQEARECLLLANNARSALAALTQEQTDRIVLSLANAAREEAGRLASLAVEETRFGRVEDKIAKNLFAAQDVYKAISEWKTAGIIHRDEARRVWEVAYPVGIVAGIIPSTNPTSTTIFKTLIALKSRNPIVFSPHPAAARCTAETVRVLQEAAERAGAPRGAITCVTRPTVASAKELMTHSLTNMILATGGGAMVKAAYSSGKPAYGVGPGNVPVYLHASASIPKAVTDIIRSKTFDYGTICASEQSVVVDRAIRRKVIEEFRKQGAYFLDDHEKQRVAAILMVKDGLNPGIVGKKPQEIAEMAGIMIPPQAKLLLAEEAGIGKAYPFSMEKLSPILALYTVGDWREASRVCRELLDFGGLGHTLGIHSEDSDVTEAFALEQPVSRMVVNTGTTFGAIGATTGILPSLTLGCGTEGNNVSSDNIGPKHLINIRRITFGIREMETSASKEEVKREPASEQAMISKDEIMEIIKGVLAELKV